jgi:hypothetical protein
MQLKTVQRRFSLFLAALAASVALVPSVVRAQTAAPATTTAQKKHLNFIQRHPTATGVAAGIATHQALKMAAARDKARGKKLNFAERHPTMMGIGAGVITHHEIKKHTPKQ